MFPWLGKVVVRFWPLILFVWIGTLAAGLALAPRWDDVTSNSEVDGLPRNSESRSADELFAKSFLEFSPGNIALVIVRDPGELTQADRTFIAEHVLGKPRHAKNGKTVPPTGLQKVIEDVGKEYEARQPPEETPINSILSLEDPKVGALLVSPDKKATVVLLDVKSPFQDLRNVDLTRRVEDAIAALRAEGKIPLGLEIGIAGSATAGRDLDVAEADGAKAIERWTITIVVVLLVLLYRAPLVAVIPLLTVFVSVEVSMHFLSLLAKYKIFVPARDLRVFVTVLSYGAGVDYCLFLIARYREELDAGLPPDEALSHTIGRVGGPITASAAVVIGGIAMLSFASFGKLANAGLVIPLALTLALLGTLTFAAACLRLAGAWAFWPHHVEKDAPHPAGVWGWLVDAADLPNVWDRIGPVLIRWPGTIFVAANLLLAPFVYFGVAYSRDHNFNPLSDLPPEAPSRRGSALLQKHFPVGALGPVTVLVKNDTINFADPKVVPAIETLTKRLYAEMPNLGLEDVRSLAEPLGYSEVAKAKWASVRDQKNYKEEARTQALGHYVGEKDEHVMRLELTLADDPLGPGGIAKFERVREKLRDLLPDELRGSRVAFSGPTASLRDLTVIKQRDQDLVQMLVSAVVFVMLLIVLRRVVVSVYLVVSVLLSYVATLGMTDLLFRFLIPEFVGLDWKVPVFLFTILVAVGEDYNIFLLTRVKEEQDDFGPLNAIPHALSRTGQVISACGIVMAGTFASLLSGSLLAMKQLGFALAVGVLLDTMLVRPILVPTFLVLLQKIFPGPIGEFMALGRWRPTQERVGQDRQD